MTDARSDDVLVQQAITDANAFATLYRRHLKRVYNYLLSRTGNTQDAQDLTTLTFMAALDGLESYQPQGKFPAWLIGIARRKAIDHFRKRTVIVSIDEIAPLQDSTQSPENMIIRQLQIETVASLLKKINPDRAEAIQLRFFGSLKMREIAVLLGKSDGAVKMLIARGLDDLRAMLTRMEKTS